MTSCNEDITKLRDRSSFHRSRADPAVEIVAGEAERRARIPNHRPSWGTLLSV
jgi:hypothetical protein